MPSPLKEVAHRMLNSEQLSPEDWLGKRPK